MKTFVQEKASPLPIDIQSEPYHIVKISISASRKIIIRNVININFFNL